MSFSHTKKTLKSGNTYDSHARSEMCAHEEKATVEAEIDANERNNGAGIGFSLDMIEEKVKANLQPLYAQISALTEMMNRLIQGNSARVFTTASTRKLNFYPNRYLLKCPEPLDCQLSTANNRRIHTRHRLSNFNTQNPR